MWDRHYLLQMQTKPLIPTLGEGTQWALEREGRKSHSGPFPDFLGTAGFIVTLRAAFEYKAKTL